jgi:hypothetical protein
MDELDTYVYICIYINSILIDDGDTKGSPRNALILCHHVYICMCVTSLFPPPYLQKKTSRPETRETKNRLCVRMYVCVSVTYRHSIYARSPY